MKKALLSVSNKEGIVELANFLQSKNVEIISTGGTAKKLQEAGISITPISSVTGNPEAFGGRMKTISFQVESAILFRRDHDQDKIDAKNLNIEAIDYVVCNLYPFQAVSRTTDHRATLIENIDIGGPTMIRAAAKNYESVTILTDPSQYDYFMENFSTLNAEHRYQFAMDAFKMTAEYDQYIFSTLAKDSLPIASTVASELRYGENPHQKASIIPWKNTKAVNTLANAPILQGKALSYNNYMDMDAGWKCTSELNELYPEKFITTVIKHANPCGVAISGKDLIESLTEAWACDPVSSFGSIISFNKEVTEEIALFFKDKFVEILMAPSFTKKALTLLSTKKNLRLVEIENKNYHEHFEQVIKSINGGLLIQEEDELHHYEFKNMTLEEIPQEMNDLKNFGMIVNKYLKSNGIGLVGIKNNCLALAGAGMGQPNRLDSLKMLAAPRAKELGYNLEEVLLVSDAFFPFRDSIDVCAEMNIKYILQPGGSIRDEEVISACNENKIAMEFTATRHFRH